MLHAALLLLMLEGTTDPVFTISLKRRTQDLQLSTSWAGRLHHLLSVERTCRSTTIAAGGQHSIHEAHDGKSEREALRSIWKPAKPFRHDVGRGAAHKKPAVA